MRVNFHLEQVLLKHGEKKRGLIQKIASATRLQRHQVAALLGNRVKHLPLDSLGAICQYLMDRHNISRTQLPAILFALAPEDFWELLGARQFVEICFGVRPDDAGPEMIVASDSYLHGVLLKQLFEAKPKFRGPEEGYSLVQQLVPAFGGSVSDAEVIEKAHAVFEDFEEHPGDRALACLGSIKSNPVIEIPISRTFKATPFQPQNDAAVPRDRSCPFFLRYRYKRDPHAPSCYAGTVLAKGKKNAEPGIHYELPSGKWAAVPWTATQDAALVMYTHRPAVEVVELVMGGFSSRSTNSLAEALPQIAAKLWPPAIDRDELKLGVFVVRFTYPEQPGADADNERAALLPAAPSEVKVFPLSAAVLERRLDGQ
jgi:hypothetical protein